ncbi:MAG: hypothetical protein JWN30_1026 [Bacilli bacterium]|nr:hypothetical protein [Bacilli bacterium]
MKKSLGSKQYFAGLVQLVEQQLSSVDERAGVLLELENVGDVPCLVCSWQREEYSEEVIHKLAAVVCDLLHDVTAVEDHVESRLLDDLEQYIQKQPHLFVDGWIKFRFRIS